MRVHVSWSANLVEGLPLRIPLLWKSDKISQTTHGMDNKWQYRGQCQGRLEGYHLLKQPTKLLHE